MFCPKCGQQNPDEAKFCGKCGATVSMAAASPPQSAYAAPGAASVTSGAVSPTLKNGMIVASIIAPIVGIVAGVIFLIDPNPEKKAAGKLWLTIGLIAAVVWVALFGA